MLSLASVTMALLMRPAVTPRGSVVSMSERPPMANQPVEKLLATMTQTAKTTVVAAMAAATIAAGPALATSPVPTEVELKAQLAAVEKELVQVRSEKATKAAAEKAAAERAVAEKASTVKKGAEMAAAEKAAAQKIAAQKVAAAKAAAEKAATEKAAADKAGTIKAAAVQVAAEEAAAEKIALQKAAAAKAASDNLAAEMAAAAKVAAEKAAVVTPAKAAVAQQPSGEGYSPLADPRLVGVAIAGTFAAVVVRDFRSGRPTASWPSYPDELDGYEPTSSVGQERREASKLAWLAKQDLPVGAAGAGLAREPRERPLPSGGVTASAKAAWQAKQQAPVWGLADLGRDMAAARSLAASARDGADSEAQSLREARKAAWLAKQELPVGGVEAVTRTAVRPPTQARAPAEWPPAEWRGAEAGAAGGVRGVAAKASELAKAAWFAKQDMPLSMGGTGSPTDAAAPRQWGPARGAPMSASEAEGLRAAQKAAWLAKQELPVGGIETPGGVAAKWAAMGWGKDPNAMRSEGQDVRAATKAKWLQKQGVPVGGAEGARAPSMPDRRYR